jgi:signal transduction histidine kinase
MAEEAGNYSAQELTQLGGHMHQTADNLFTLLKNLLEWAQMQNGSMIFNPKEFSLSDMIAKNVETMRERSQQKGITIINKVIGSVDAYLDEKMIYSVLLNLLSNAVKFTHRNGMVTINTKKIDHQMVEISISDTGVGIQKSIIEKLFKVGEKTGNKGTEGELTTGLGLLLCKEFVERHGGIIWVESEEGIGSTFYFTLPSHKL